MTDQRDFPTLDVLTAITGKMVICDIVPVYGVLNYMTGESLFTHQLPRVGREAQAVMLRLRSELGAAVAESEQIDATNWRDFAALWLDRYGPTIAVPQMTADDHERIDPLSELVEKVSPDRIAELEGPKP